jgi:hypothetical protein
LKDQSCLFSAHLSLESAFVECLAQRICAASMPSERDETCATLGNVVSMMIQRYLEACAIQKMRLPQLRHRARALSPWLKRWRDGIAEDILMREYGL